jgi:hypothetical protein
MQTNSAAVIILSPTGTAKKILLAITQGVQITQPRLIDFTSASSRQSSLERIEEDLSSSVFPFMKNGCLR